MTRLDFEDLPANTKVTTQFSERGVVFPKVAFLDTDPAARSGTRVLRAGNPGDEFHPRPFVMEFTTPQAKVRFFAGGNFSPASGVLRAFDGSGAIIAQDGPKEVTPRQFTTPFEVSVPTPSIVRVELEIGSSVFEAIDDLEFEGETPPPLPSEPPVVEITSQLGDLDTPEITVQGTITGEGLLGTATLHMQFGLPPGSLAPGFRITLFLNGSGNTRTFEQTILVNPGPHSLTVEVENIGGLKGSHAVEFTNLPQAIRARHGTEGGTETFGALKYGLLEGGCKLAVYERGAIAAAGRTTFVVRGEIFRKWLALKDSFGVAGRLGCPTSEAIERPAGDIVQNFVRGQIVAFQIRARWRTLGAESGPLGAPLTDTVLLPDGEIVFFKYGCLWIGESGKVFYADFDMPLLGRPQLYSLKDTPPVLTIVNRAHEIAGIQRPNRQNIPILRGALEGRFFLKAVGDAASASTLVPLAISRESMDGFQLNVPRADLGRLRDRQLYDIVLRLPNGQHHILSAHSVYATSSTWENFSFIHVTDIHVAERVDRFHRSLRRLVRAGKVRPEALTSFNNFNHNFCNFIRYANRLHAREELDFIVATGDLVDYLFEKGDTTKHAGGNFAFFKSLVLGQGTSPVEPSTDERPNEELRVPIFTTLGNHDYRTNPYGLIFRASVTLDDFLPVDIPLIGGIEVKAKNREEYQQFNLRADEALALEGVNERPSISGNTAFKMLEIDPGMKVATAFYFREINRAGRYTINLGGRHSVVMLDTGPDSGVTSDPGKLLKAYLGFGSAKTKKFIAGFTNSEGITTGDLTRVRNALNETKGLVIVGMHAPPLCHADKEFSHFFRETEHARAPIADTMHFLVRHQPQFVGPPLKKETVGFGASTSSGQDFRPTKPIRGISAEKIRGWRVDGTTFFRKAKGLDDSLAEGVADNSDAFLALCVGGETSRKVNLVLCGHGHANIEYRLRFDKARKEFEYFLDYYTENPGTYYNSREFAAHGKEMVVQKDFENTPEIAIKTKKGLRFPGSISGKAREVPPFADPLNSTPDAARWWEARSPLIIQTAPLGWLDSNQRPEENGGQPIQPAFQGMRVIDVRNDVIRRIRVVKLDEIGKEANQPVPTFGSTSAGPIAGFGDVVARTEPRSRAVVGRRQTAAPRRVERRTVVPAVRGRTKKIVIAAGRKPKVIAIPKQPKT